MVDDNNIFVSSLTHRKYNIKKCARVADRRLQTFYITKNCMPVQLWPSRDDNGHDIIVMLFDKEQTAKYYQEWLDNNPKKKGGARERR